jgi:hypothetical protein
MYSKYYSGIYDLKYCSIYACNTTDNTAPEATPPPESTPAPKSTIAPESTMAPKLRVYKPRDTSKEVNQSNII